MFFYATEISLPTLANQHVANTTTEGPCSKSVAKTGFQLKTFYISNEVFAARKG